MDIVGLLKLYNDYKNSYNKRIKLDKRAIKLASYDNLFEMIDNFSLSYRNVQILYHLKRRLIKKDIRQFFVMLQLKIDFINSLQLKACDLYNDTGFKTVYFDNLKDAIIFIDFLKDNNLLQNI